MKIYQCDRCGSTYQTHPDIVPIGMLGAPYRMFKYGRSEVDLCRACLAKWIEWLHDWWNTAEAK